MRDLKICDLSDGYALHYQDGVAVVITPGGKLLCSATELCQLTAGRAFRADWHRLVCARLAELDSSGLRASEDSRWRAASQAELAWRSNE
jgi:hypothetical protein